MKLFKKILIGLGFLALVSGSIQVDGILWLKTNQFEKASVVRVPSSKVISGDSVILYQGQTAILEDVYIKYVPYASAYTVANHDDTVKIYGTLDNIPVYIGYIADTLFTESVPNVSYSPASIGPLDGTLYYVIFPDSKFTGGDAYLDIISKFIIFK